MRNMLVKILALCVLLSAGPALAQDSGALKKIRDAKSITLGYRSDSPPFSFTGNDGQPAGYSVDICRRVVTSLERGLGGALAIKWVALSAADRFDKVASGAVDVECGNTSATLSRMERFDFSSLIFVDGGGVLVLADSKVGRLGDLNGKTVVAVAGTTTEQSLAAALKAKLVDAKVLAVKDETDALAALQSGKADGYAADRVKLVVMVIRAQGEQKAAGKFRLIQEDYSIEPYALMMKRDPALRLAVNRGLAQLYRSGAITEIYDRWLSPLGKPTPLLTAVYILGAVPE